MRTLFFDLTGPNNAPFAELLITGLTLLWGDNDIQTHRAFEIVMYRMHSVFLGDYLTDIFDEGALILIEDSFVHYQGYLVLHNL